MTFSSPQEKIRQLILNWLTRRDYSPMELLRKLNAKGFLETDINPILEDFVRVELINEARFTVNYIASRRTKGMGPLRILMELRARGIDEEMIAERIKITDNAWFIEAHIVWKKHFKNKLPSNFKEKTKQMRFLQYRGFTQEQIENIFARESIAAE